jgi:hypothetical protein
VERETREFMEGESGMRVRESKGIEGDDTMSAMKEGGSSYRAMATTISEWKKMEKTLQP